MKEPEHVEHKRVGEVRVTGENYFLVYDAISVVNAAEDRDSLEASVWELWRIISVVLKRLYDAGLLCCRVPEPILHGYRCLVVDGCEIVEQCPENEYYDAIELSHVISMLTSSWLDGVSESEAFSTLSYWLKYFTKPWQYHSTYLTQCIQTALETGK